MISIAPSLILILGALLVPFFRGTAKKVYLVLVPVLALWSILANGKGVHWVVEILDYQMIFGRVDDLSFPFAIIFALAAILGVIYSLGVDDDRQQISCLVYAASGQGVVMAGDFLTLYLFWEIMAFAAAYIIWAGGTRTSIQAGYRYLLVHIVGGLFLLAGIVLYFSETGSLTFDHIGLNGSMAAVLILIGFGINAAFPLLHAWLPDAYPEASFAGTVFLSAFTTKSAVYVLARGFAGVELLIWVGALMTAFPIFYAVIENNLRKVLSYSLINQVGFMIVGVGIGTTLAINGTVAHAFAHILYKALLFMSMGAVLFRTGKINATDLGGLYKTMPLTALCCIVGAASISGFPLTSGFVSKSMIISGAGQNGLVLIWFALLFASAGVFHHSGIKIPFFAFFSHDSGLRPKEAPVNMLVAMGITAFLCIFIGVFPQYLYAILPYPVEYIPYTSAHVVDQLQILFFSALAFTLLMRSGIYPAERRGVNLDVDWFYRKGARKFMWLVNNPIVNFEFKFVGQAYETLVVKPMMKIAYLMSVLDRAVVEGTINGICRIIVFASRWLSAMQTGRLHTYTYIMCAGLIVILLAAMIISPA
ncbi:MAG: Na(+)/H(+) antiporter subunit D [Desulfurivibrio sp.]